MPPPQARFSSNSRKNSSMQRNEMPSSSRNTSNRRSESSYNPTAADATSYSSQSSNLSSNSDAHKPKRKRRPKKKKQQVSLRVLWMIKGSLNNKTVSWNFCSSFTCNCKHKGWALCLLFLLLSYTRLILSCCSGLIGWIWCIHIYRFWCGHEMLRDRCWLLFAFEMESCKPYKLWGLKSLLNICEKIKSMSSLKILESLTQWTKTSIKLGDFLSLRQRAAS